MTPLDATLENLVRQLLAARDPRGHWRGRLSSSALSTATALVALQLAADSEQLRQSPPSAETIRPFIRRGLAWLAEHQNPDGGWGDTTLSFSNISTTALCWGALRITGGQQTQPETWRRVEQWLQTEAGGLEPDNIAGAILRRYGKDRTFSVPIVMLLALTGSLGEPGQAWRRVPQLPFELAACPRSWFRIINLPVVSYALPALIAIGWLRHHKRPSWNPITRMLRALTHKRTGRILAAIQPPNGGFLEATPLTAFVSMSLLGSRAHDHPALAPGLTFLINSARPDGSWPIDTDLATWVTSLAIKALNQIPQGLPSALDQQSLQSIKRWLLDQQWRRRHPYTDAPPGGWAWTDLPGGVPDADDTPGALLALLAITHAMDEDGPDEETRKAATQAIRWLQQIQNRDGGIPTFCKGWGALPFDRSSPDLTAHTLLAWRAWQALLDAKTAAAIEKSCQRALRFLLAKQRPDGSWLPLWFGNQHRDDEENPIYGTARVVLALHKEPQAQTATNKALRFLENAQQHDGGWSGGPQANPSSLEETALALLALQSARQTDPALLAKGRAFLNQQTQQGKAVKPSPIGFYFAKLWYYEELYPLIFTTEAIAALQNGTGSPTDSSPA